MNPLLGWFAREVLAPEVLSRAYERLRDEHWRKRLSDRVARSLDFRISRKRLQRWLDRQDTWRALAEPTPEGVEALVADARTVVRSGWPWARIAEADLEVRSGELVAGLIREFLSSLDPSYATAIAHVREMRQLRSIATDTSRILERLERPDHFESQLARLPPGTDTQLRDLHGLAPSLADQMAGLLSGDEAVEVAVHLVESAPAWLESAPGAAWAALSEFTSAHRRRNASATAAERAVEAAIPRPARWIAKAASQLQIEDPGRSSVLLTRAEELAGSGDLFVAAVRTSLMDAIDEMRSLLRNVPADDPDALTLLSYRAQAELFQGDVNAAISTLEAAATMAPLAAGVLLLTSDAWLRVASRDDRAGRGTALQKVTDFAVRAREVRRRWDGPSFEATRRLCLAGALALDWESVLSRAYAAGVAT